MRLLPGARGLDELSRLTASPVRILTGVAAIVLLLATRLLLAFAGFALFLGCIGLHGLTVYAVARRTSEIGLRIALGAQRADVLWLILRQVVLVIAVGLTAGIPLAIAGGKAVASLLYGVKPIDPASLVIATVTMTVVAGLAAYVPARRAARLEPLAALRVD